MTWVSYAQNFEDVILMRALGHIDNGFYIDIGAQHPIIDSVSKAFYEKGWQGIDVEPVAAYAELLRKDRPKNTIIQSLIGGNSTGAVEFFTLPGTGLSTASKAIAARHEAAGFQIVSEQVNTLTLAALFRMADNRTIHWLKIDVEGFEQTVLKSWGRHPARPWIVVVESTLPLTQEPSYQVWEPLLLRRGYRFVYFDGLNRFYIHKTQIILRKLFDYGPCVFDDFRLSGLASSPFCKSH